MLKHNFNDRALMFDIMMASNGLWKARERERERANENKDTKEEL